MDDPITDSETTSEGAQSFDPVSTESESPTTATIVHHNGSTVVTDFTRIEEINVEQSTVRVWHDEVYGSDYTDYYGATITEVDL